MSPEPDPALRAALREALDGGPAVDTVALVAGARAGARRLRRRRRAVTSVLAVLAVVAVPAGYQVLVPGGQQAAQVATAPSTTAPSPLVEPSSPASSTSPPPSTPAPSTPPPAIPLVSLAAPAAVPDRAALEPGDFDRPVQLLLDTGEYVNGPTADGQECGPGSAPSGTLPGARRAWTWVQERSNRLDQLQVDLTVTGWRGGGSTALERLAADTGYCRWHEPTTPERTDDLPGDGRWAGSSQSGQLSNGYAVVQLGDVLVAVSVTHPDGREAAVAEAKRLVVVAAARTVEALT